MGNEDSTGIKNFDMAPQKSKVIEIELYRDFYFPGDSIEGDILLKPLTPLLVEDIKMEFVYQTKFYCKPEEKSKSDYVVRGERKTVSTQTIDIRKEMNVNARYLKFSTSVYRFPFKLKAPANLFPSFEFPLPENRAYIRYTLIAYLEGPKMKTKTERFIKLAAKPSGLFKEESLSSNVYVKRFLIGKGRTVMNVSYESRNYKPGQEVEVKINVDNKECKINFDKLHFEIIRTVKLCDNGDRVIKAINQVMYRKDSDFYVEKRGTNSVTEPIQITDQFLDRFSYAGFFEVFPDFDLNSLLISIDSPYIKCLYNLKITGEYAIPVSDASLPVVMLPLSITNQIESDYQLFLQEERERKKEYQKELLTKKEKQKELENEEKLKEGREQKVEEEIQRKAQEEVESKAKEEGENMQNEQYYDGMGQEIPPYNNENMVSGNYEEQPGISYPNLNENYNYPGYPQMDNPEYLQHMQMNCYGANNYPSFNELNGEYYQPSYNNQELNFPNANNGEIIVTQPQPQPNENEKNERNSFNLLDNDKKEPVPLEN